MISLIKHFCRRDELSTFDPYDIWNTSGGYLVKTVFNKRPALGVMPAAIVSLLDNLMNYRLRRFYRPAEYPIVRAMAALCLLRLYRTERDQRLLEQVERHLQWLLMNSCRGFSGYCWGHGFPIAVSEGLVYGRDTPLSTITPYVLEAFIAFAEAAQDDRFATAIESIFRFFDNDIQVMEEDGEAVATSYAPFRDRTVVNAVSYTMYAYSMFLPYAATRDKPRIESRITKLYSYIRRVQRPDGSWLYIAAWPLIHRLFSFVHRSQECREDESGRTGSIGRRCWWRQATST